MEENGTFNSIRDARFFDLCMFELHEVDCMFTSTYESQSIIFLDAGNELFGQMSILDTVNVAS